MNIFLNMKHWMLFLLIMVPAVAPNFISHLFHPKYVFATSFLIWIVVILGWLYSIAISANSRLPENLRRSTSVLNFVLPFAVVYCLYTSQSFLSLDSGPRSSEPPVWLVPAHLFSMFGIFYTMWFAAKQLTTLLENREVKFTEFAGRFFLFWFFPLGVWFVQPEVNKNLGSNA